MGVADAALQGFVDDYGPDRVRGWAWDARSPDHPVVVEVRARDRSLGAARADVFRPDLVIPGTRSGRQGFEVRFREPIPADWVPDVVVRIRGTDVRLGFSRRYVPGSEAPQFVPPGHFYSPIPSLGDVRADEARIFAVPAGDLPGIDLREDAQLALMSEFKRYYDEQPFPAHPTPERRYYFENGAYSYSDAIVLYCMIRHARPRRIIEVGSGHSSCVTLDTNDLFFDGRIVCTLIEPYPELLQSLLRPEDAERVELLLQRVQDVPLARFRALEAGDILFVDSTHVSKAGSDVNYIVFEILPVLAPGVFVHFHDVFHPFEYPKEWIFAGRTWTEAYLLRAFLQFNRSFEVVFFNTFLEHFHEARFAAEMPLCLKNPGGSLWIRRIA